MTATDLNRHQGDRTPQQGAAAAFGWPPCPTTEACATFGPQGLVDMLYLAGCYDTIASILNTFKV